MEGGGAVDDLAQVIGRLDKMGADHERQRVFDGAVLLAALQAELRILFINIGLVVSVIGLLCLLVHVPALLLSVQNGLGVEHVLEAEV
eukprot:CAMPEP_0170504594 /NCGR_PEP_ID=MMETSP0208-20121228/48361_1 /TAXON_ID=197538 /ORGANISM="Strombidium inclinatum, Strain S3" /LENGTH=87 /DNA_ID=CAMNT_0010784943 /DNA_START=1071 /DNA_END=1334 /DNA_ORIENTATION=-